MSKEDKCDFERLPTGVNVIKTPTVAAVASYIIHQYDRPVSWRNEELVTYQDGAWSSEPMAAIRALVTSLHGTNPTTAGSKPVSVTPKFCDAVVQSIRDQLKFESDRFWDTSTHWRWVAFSDRSIRWNGTDLEEAEHSPDHRATMKFDRAWGNWRKGCKNWDRVLGEWCETEDEDGKGQGWCDEQKRQKMNAIKTWVGLTILGGANAVRRALFLHGRPGTGKSTAVGMIGGIFPESSRTSSEPSSWNDEKMIAMIANAQINVCPEVDVVRGVPVNKVKSAVLGEQVAARRIYGSPFIFNPECAHVWAGNGWMNAKDESGAIMDRLLPIEFSGKRYRDSEEEDRNLSETLDGEQAAIVRQCVAAAVVSLRNNKGRIVVPETSKSGMKRQKAASDPVAGFISVMNQCELGASCGMTGSAAYELFKQWCEINSEDAMTQTAFGRRLGRLVTKKRTSAGVKYGIEARVNDGKVSLSVLDAE